MAFLIALLPAALLLAVGVLVVQGELVIGRGGLSETRLWLVRESGSAGLGASIGSNVQGGEDGPQACVETHVRFLLWRSDGSLQQATYCECFERSDDEWIYSGACP